ncbi:MAG: site-2 protease family protein [Chloroflexi bacterium]|nr:site-2 protease family protein [Chloroflexota bacterium]
MTPFTLLIFLGLLALLIVSHELGHFVTAKLSGVTVKEFGLGFPPRIFGIKRGETVYSINAIPLGGFVKMVGEEDPKLPGSLAGKSIGVRLMVLTAGSAMNLLLPLVLLAVSLMVPHQVVSEQVIVKSVATGSPAERAGVRPGDTILKIEGDSIQNRGDVGYNVALKLGSEVRLLLRGQDGSTRETLVMTRWNPPAGQGAMGIVLEPVGTTVSTQSRPFWQAFPQGARTALETMILFKNEVVSWFVRKTPPQVTGPVGIAQVTGEIAREGLSPLLRFGALLSLNLGIFNLFPLPALDGGRLVFVLLEWVRRGRRIPPEKENLVHLIGFAVILAAMVLVTYLDIVRIVQGEQLMP